MDLVIVAVAGGFILLAMGFGVVFARLISRDRITLPEDETDAIFSPTRYRAMEQLLEEADQNLAAAQGRDAEKKLRKVRVHIFRSYTQQLSDDFERISKALKALMVASEVDRPDLAGFLMKQQLLFSVVMMSVEIKLIPYELGWSGVDVSGLLRSLQRMRTQLESLAAAAEPSMA